MTHYTEYEDLFDEWTYGELKKAYRALTNTELQDELYQEESPLLIFLIDTSKQEQLYLYFEDIKNDEATDD